MYYPRLGIRYATSTDGITWQPGNNGEPVITAGPDGSWYEKRVFAGGLIMQLDTLRMFFRGDNDTIFSKVGYA